MFLDRRTALLVTLGFLLFTASVDGQAQEAGESVIIEQPVDGDLYAAGGEVEVLAPVSGDAVLAGGTVRVSDRVGGDVISAGGNIRLIGSVADDVRLAGGRVAVQGVVSGHAVVAGGDVQIASDAEIGDFAWLAGGRLEIAGTVGSDLKAAGREIVLSGRVDGNADLVGQSIRIADSAIIHGNLTWSSPSEPDIGESAEVAGATIKSELRSWEPELRYSWIAGILAVASLTVAAGLLFSFFPAWCNRLAGSMRDRPVASPFVGLAVIVTIPVVMVLLFLTGIGVLLGLLLVLGYGMMLMLGWLLGVIAAASLLRPLISKRQPGAPLMAWLGIVLIAVIIALANAIEPLGIIIATLILCYGTGALVTDIYTIFQAARR